MFAPYCRKRKIELNANIRTIKLAKTQNKPKVQVSKLQKSQTVVSKTQVEQPLLPIVQNPEQKLKTSLLMEQKSYCMSTNAPKDENLSQQKKSQLITCNCYNFTCFAPAFKEYFRLESQVQKHVKTISEQDGGEIHTKRKEVFSRIKQLVDKKKLQAHSQKELQVYEYMFKTYDKQWLKFKRLHKEHPDKEKIKICQQKLKTLRQQQKKIIQALSGWSLTQFDKLVQAKNKKQSLDMIALIQKKSNLIKKQIQWEQMRFKKEQQKRLAQDKEYLKGQIQVLKQFMIEKERKYLLQIQQTMNRKNKQIINQYVKKLEVESLNEKLYRTQYHKYYLEEIRQGLYQNESEIYRNDGSSFFLLELFQTQETPSKVNNISQQKVVKPSVVNKSTNSKKKPKLIKNN